MARQNSLVPAKEAVDKIFRILSHKHNRNIHLTLEEIEVLKLATEALSTISSYRFVEKDSK